tara:strand:+ start:3562 stop:4644 length:1083 start_codon:yes stop_codon:yes gene_type:complete
MIKLEYVWLDGYDTPNLRSKVKFIESDEEDGFHAHDHEHTHDTFTLDDVPEWGFDGSSTQQADGDSSDCVLKPVRIYNHPFNERFFGKSYVVLCEVYNTDGTPHRTNTRSKLVEIAEEYNDSEMWFGIEQEYVFMNPKTERPYGWPEKGFPNPQGRYYCGVGGDVTRLRSVAEGHATTCLNVGIKVGGINSEVMLSQWEYQIGTLGPVDICDDLWIARWILESLAEDANTYVSLSPKPIQGDWNGSGAHINFSTKRLREEGGESYINSIIEEFSDYHKEHIKEYGVGNKDRLTGKHETQHIDVFSSGSSDRGASIRIPPATLKENKGYLEDRRPAANMDPYRAIYRMVKTIGFVDSLQKV